MPQIEVSTFASQIFWLLIFFGITFFVVGRGMVPKVMDTVAQRDKQIADDLAAAEGARAQADQEEAAWRTRENANRAQAQTLIVDARAQAAAASAERLAAAQTRIDATVTDAEARIAAAEAFALASPWPDPAAMTNDLYA